MDTYKIIEDIERKIKDEENIIKKNKIFRLISLIFSSLFLIAFIIFLIIYFNNKEKITLIFAIIFLGLTILSISLLLMFNLTIRGRIKSIHMMEEALKSWRHKKPKISVPLDMDRK